MTDVWGDQLEKWIHSACVLEATAPKVGNVHPNASFEDLCFNDFIDSARVIAPILADSSQSVGERILAAIQSTQRVVGKNTNLGIVLLLAPLAAVDDGVSLRNGIKGVLAGCGIDDSACVYRAIQFSQAGGMGQVDQHDISEQPKLPLVELMQFAKDRDSIALQYTNGFDFVLGDGLSWIHEELERQSSLNDAIVRLQLRTMAALPDTLIARKCGSELARQAALMAQSTLDASSDTAAKLKELDDWLRADGNRRNPGTTADLVCAILFAYMREHRTCLDAVAGT